jgi:hypothetical protein
MALMIWDWMLRPLPRLDEERRPRWRPLNESLGSLAPSSDEDQRQPEREEGAHDEDGDEARSDARPVLRDQRIEPGGGSEVMLRGYPEQASTNATKVGVSAARCRAKVV